MQYSNQKKGMLLAFTAIMFITPDSLFIRLANINSWNLISNINVDKPWFENTYAKLSNWLNNLVESKLFISVMDKYLEYNSSQRPLITNFS